MKSNNPGTLAIVGTVSKIAGVSVGAAVVAGKAVGSWLRNTVATKAGRSVRSEKKPGRVGAKAGAKEKAATKARGSQLKVAPAKASVSKPAKTAARAGRTGATKRKRATTTRKKA
ncbi:unnamed protein product, partial [marine sediment metagenome]